MGGNKRQILPYLFKVANLLLHMKSARKETISISDLD